MTPRAHIGVLGCAFVLAACGGAMGHARLAAESGDLDKGKELNAPIAVGASLRPEVRTDLQGATAPLLLVSTRPEVVSSDQGKLVAHAPGVVAILITTQDGTVIDFYHLWAAKATRVALHRSDEQGKDLGEVVGGLDLLVGESIRLVPKPYFVAQQMAGTVSAEWTATPAIVDFLRQGVGAERRMVARIPGEAVLSVVVSGVESKLPIRVLPSPAECAAAAKSSSGESQAAAGVEPAGAVP